MAAPERISSTAETATISSSTRPGDGADVIFGLGVGAGSEDRISLAAFAGVAGFADVLSRATQVGTDTVIDFGAGDTLTLRNVLRASSADDFVFVSPGDDHFTAIGGNETFDAGGGIDTVTFGFRLVDATVSYAGNRSSSNGLEPHGADRLRDLRVHRRHGQQQRRRPLVDDLFYYSQNHDVWNAHADADAHYHAVGWHEGRDPNAFFSTAIYLSANPDVRAPASIRSSISTRSAGRKAAFPRSLSIPRQYLAANPDVRRRASIRSRISCTSAASEGRQPIAPTELIAANGFDYVYYLQHNPDVAAAGVDPLRHFQTAGWKEGRNPNALFDTAGYLATYTDVQPRTSIRSTITISSAGTRAAIRRSTSTPPPICGQSGRRGRAHQSAEALPRVRHPRGPLAVRRRRVGLSARRRQPVSLPAGYPIRAHCVSCARSPVTMLRGCPVCCGA